MCIITFYSAQVHLLRDKIRNHVTFRCMSSHVPVHTVDSFQGSEADIVIISFVRGNKHNSTGFLKDYRRLNVALTRAKHVLLCVGNAACLGNLNPHETADERLAAAVAVVKGSQRCINSMNVDTTISTVSSPYVDVLQLMIADALNRNRMFLPHDID